MRNDFIYKIFILVFLLVSSDIDAKSHRHIHKKSMHTSAQTNDAKEDGMPLDYRPRFGMVSRSQGLEDGWFRMHHFSNKTSVLSDCQRNGDILTNCQKLSSILEVKEGCNIEVKEDPDPSFRETEVGPGGGNDYFKTGGFIFLHKCNGVVSHPFFEFPDLD